MPLFSFVCSACNHIDEILESVAPTSTNCVFCGSVSVRDFSKEGVNFCPDIEPGYNLSLGMDIGSRRELREALAIHNAAAPGLMQNSYPSAGRITSAEERLEAMGHTTRSGNSILERRSESGWKPRAENEHVVDEEITVEGKADYAPIRESLKRRHRQGRRNNA